MLGGSHAATGALAGVLLAGWLSDPGLLAFAAAAGVGAGAALLPDLDSTESTATRSQGPVSRWASDGVRAASRAVFCATRTRYDGGGLHGNRGAHRHLTHTAPAAAAAGALCAALSAHWAGAGVVLWVLLSLGLRGLGQCLTGRDRASLSQWGTVSLGAALAVVVVSVVDPLHPSLVGVLVGVGMVVHTLGDWLTKQGVPLVWPLRVRGARWWMFRSPLGFAADADCWQEKFVRAACLVGTPAVALLMA